MGKYFVGGCLMLVLSATVCSGDIILNSSTARVIGSGTVGRAGSVDSQSFDTSSDGVFGLVSPNESQTVGPLPFQSSLLPGTAAVGTSTASTSIDYRSLEEINIDLLSTVALNSIETDGNGVGSYGISSQSSFNLSFIVDEATNYQFSADINFVDDSPSWQVRLQGTNGFIFNHLTNTSGDELLASNVLQPGTYTLSGYASNGLGGPIPATTNTTSINMNFQAPRAVPEPTSATVILMTSLVIVLRRRQTATQDPNSDRFQFSLQ